MEVAGLVRRCRSTTADQAIFDVDILSAELGDHIGEEGRRDDVGASGIDIVLSKLE